MKTKTKRLQAIFLALAMSVGVLQASAFAAHEVTPWVAGHENHKLVVDEDSAVLRPLPSRSNTRVLLSFKVLPL